MIYAAVDKVEDKVEDKVFKTRNRLAFSGALPILHT